MVNVDPSSVLTDLSGFDRQIAGKGKKRNKKGGQPQGAKQTQFSTPLRPSFRFVSFVRSFVCCRRALLCSSLLFFRLQGCFVCLLSSTLPAISSLLFIPTLGSPVPTPSSRFLTDSVPVSVCVLLFSRCCSLFRLFFLSSFLSFSPASPRIPLYFPFHPARGNCRLRRLPTPVLIHSISAMLTVCVLQEGANSTFISDSNPIRYRFCCSTRILLAHFLPIASLHLLGCGNPFAVCCHTSSERIVSSLPSIQYIKHGLRNECRGQSREGQERGDR